MMGGGEVGRGEVRREEATKLVDNLIEMKPTNQLTAS